MTCSNFHVISNVFNKKAPETEIFPLHGQAYHVATDYEVVTSLMEEFIPLLILL